MRSPAEMESNQTPIKNPTMRAGASFVVRLSPTGYRLTSPSSWRKYTPTSHSGLTRPPPPLWAMVAAGTRSRNDSPTNSSPSVNFAGLEGSRGPRRTHSHANVGASMMTNVGGTDWNQLAGNANPSTESRV